MNHKLLTACVLTGLLTPAFAGANPEPTAYDTRSIGMGLTGVTFLQQPAALALNPANLEGIKKLGFTFNFTNLLVNQTAPVMGPNTSVSSGLGYGPLPSGFIAGRIAPRVVFAAGIYIETGYGSSFKDVTCLDGDPVDDDGVPDTNPSTCTNPDPQDLKVTFFVGEFASGFSFRVHEKFWLGVALRIPFSKQKADLYQNVGAALGSGNYGRVQNDLGGMGFPSPKIGFTWKPHKKVNISLMYRMYSKISLFGTTETSLLPGQVLNSTADWNIPNALAYGISYQANRHLLLAFEGRTQFHAAEKTGNQNQTVVAELNDTVLSTIVVPFGWKNVWSVKVGFEYRFTKDLLALRLGVNIAEAATTGEFAQYFTPPPGLSGNLAGGLGFYWKDRNDPSIKDKYRLDIATAFAFTKGTIGDEYIGTTALIPGTNPAQDVVLCSDDQVVRTGCPGNYKVLTYWASLSFTLQY
jgi:Outer membrane protein transport protein (OMPP1/FadL/TodX)